jgi:formylglycine-generating enzyme required for sulfatase activity
LPRTIATPAALPGYVQIPAGKFWMGSSPNEEGRNANWEAQHRVTITRSFWLKATPVTHAEYNTVMGTNSSWLKRNWPVVSVSWWEAVDYVNKLSDREGLPRAYDANRSFAGLDSRGYRLPTEAEWEYACRAESSAAQYGDLERVAWYEKNSGGRTHPVAQKMPNAWGLYDMLGNVYEWTNDRYGEYLTDGVTDPVGPASGTMHVFRGGCWKSHARFVRAAMRSPSSPPTDGIGFRPARSL